MLWDMKEFLLLNYSLPWKKDNKSIKAFTFPQIELHLFSLNPLHRLKSPFIIIIFKLNILISLLSQNLVVLKFYIISSMLSWNSILFSLCILIFSKFFISFRTSSKFLWTKCRRKCCGIAILINFTEQFRRTLL